MKISGGFSWFLVAACAVIGFVVVALNLEEATEFSPDTLFFRSAMYIRDVRVFAAVEWSTPLLDEVREKNPMAEAHTQIRWSYVHGSNLIGRRSSANGDAKPAYRLFRAGLWDDVLSDPRNKRDEILKQSVTLMRQEKYGETAEFLHNTRFAQK